MLDECPTETFIYFFIYILHNSLKAYIFIYIYLFIYNASLKASMHLFIYILNTY